MQIASTAPNDPQDIAGVAGDPDADLHRRRVDRAFARA